MNSLTSTQNGSQTHRRIHKCVLGFIFKRHNPQKKNFCACKKICWSIKCRKNPDINDKVFYKCISEAHTNTSCFKYIACIGNPQIYVLKTTCFFHQKHVVTFIHKLLNVCLLTASGLWTSLHLYFWDSLMCLFFKHRIICSQSDVSLLSANHWELSVASQMSSLLSVNPQERTPRAPLLALCSFIVK